VARRIVIIVLLGLGLAAVLYAFRPAPVPVDLGAVTRGSMRVTVDEEGQTRIRERYIVSAPLAGRLRRISMDAGDIVMAEDTVVATIDPTAPELLDARARAEAEARVHAAEAARRQADANRERARSALDFAENEHARTRAAYEGGAANPTELDAKEMLHKTRRAEFRGAEHARDIATYELEVARAALLRTQPDAVRGAGEGSRGAVGGGGFAFDIRAPISGRVLRVFQESVAVVTPGEELLEVGDPTDLEIVIDVLSTDAVRITKGAEVVIEHWGGDEPLRASIRLVEPSAFTKISALGVEEQRVNVIADFLSPLEERETLGDGFRVEGRIILWRADDVVRVPASALFRGDETWEVFVVKGGRAERRAVTIGHRNGSVAEILGGLEPGEQVVVHPGDHVEDGVRVRQRGS